MTYLKRVPAALFLVALAASAGARTNPSRAELEKQGKETLAVMERHADAMKTRDVETIVADYADDAIVIATLFPKPIVGKAELRKAVVEALKIPPITAKDETTFTTKEAVGELGYQIFENPGLTGTETYIVRNGKIVFETANITLKDAKK
ncbi:nuclear transport factor 2 family protein [Sphingomonas sp. CL5.1]|uniref:nuclear transport factor 2 family protein n=1 Tax=Sphingomonas sp. CL5.1 TaxID=2653203 RepID=UPI0015839BDA|nr:nuclear transport factor 2 family protein [Sphingomonas sp. CL5.1]QKS00564.1 nuclear transport factor 2 family protein [Sphingomonas sp. CL5.1]